MIRAVVETTAMIYWLDKKTAEFLKVRNEEAFDEFLMKGMLGSKDETTPEESYNVLTAINHLDKEFENLRKMYDTLCEFTHPNYSGVMGSYAKIEKDCYAAHLGKEHRKPSLAFGLVPLIGCIEIFTDYYNTIADKLQVLNESYE